VCGEIGLGDSSSNRVGDDAERFVEDAATAAECGELVRELAQTGFCQERRAIP
jgi:hypothetical protein